MNKLHTVENKYWKQCCNKKRVNNNNKYNKAMK